MPFRIKWTPGLVTGLIIALFIAVALFMRIYFPFDEVFKGDWIKYTSNDAYYQLRIIDNMAFNFPHVTAFDPYLIYPDGGTYGGVHFMNWLVAFLAWIAGGFSPTQHNVDMVGMYLPAVLAALTVIPAYFIGKALFNRWAGVIAAGIAAVMPGEFMGRTILGGLDKPAAEVFFTAAAIAFIIYAVKTAWNNQLSWQHIVKRDLKTLWKPLILSLLGGLFLGIYLITWEGALLFVVIAAAYFIIQFIIDRFKGHSSFYLGFTGFFIFVIAYAVFQPVAGGDFHSIVLIIAVLIPPVLALISWFMAARQFPAYFYLIALVVLGGAFLLVFNAVKPDLMDTMFTQFTYLVPVGATGTTTIEAQRLLSPGGNYTMALAWGNFTTSFFLVPWIPIPGLAFIALIALIVLYIKRRAEDKTMLLLFTWTAVILLVTLLQRRYAYYLAINMAVLSGYLCWQGIWWFSRRHNKTTLPETLAEQYRRARLVGIIGGMIAVGTSFFLVGTRYFFIPVFVLGLLSIFYGFWAWVRLKNKNEYMILWAFIFPIGIIALALSKDETSPASKRAKEQPKEKLNPWLYRFNIATLVVITFMAVFWPNYDKAVAVAAPATYAPSDAWEQAMHWLRDNTPEPLGDDKYYDLIDRSYQYPDTAYGVTAWWDYGYWITRTAHRIPSANPSQSPEPIRNVAHMFLSQDAPETQKYRDLLDTEYIVLDKTMTVGNNNTTGKLWAVATWAGITGNDYTNVFYWKYEGEWYPIRALDPEYYKLFLVKLYNFDGKASSGESPMVIAYEVKTDTAGNKINVCTEDPQQFESYREALTYMENNPDKTFYLGGSSPFANPIPMEAVTDYTLVFGSTANADQDNIPDVKIFQYTGD
jgi:oligosaccharyl transferase (archaeosortase A-associated)